MEALKQIIEESFGLRPEHFPPEVQNSVDEVIKLLQQGKLRVAEKIDGNWVTHEWIKKAVLLSFQLYPNKMVRAGDLSFFDKVPSRFDHFSESDWKESGIRCVPTAVARHGSYIAPSVVLMPSFVNIGAYIGENTMVDTWSTVGSCAQVGKNCHLSGGVGTFAGLPDNHRRQLLHRRPQRDRRRCRCGRKQRNLHGCLHRTKHEDL